MKSFKKTVAVVLTAVIMLCSLSCGVYAAYVEVLTNNEDALNLLVLGDSISQGYGVENPAEASYARIVADTNGYNYINMSRVAKDSGDLLGEIKENADVRKNIEWADIINISIGSNNYLANSYVVFLAVGALLGINNFTLDRIGNEIYDDYISIVGEIRALNPDATIIFDNVYCSWSGIGYFPFKRATARVNNALSKAKETLGDEIEILDIASVINGHPELVAEDSTHPNADGNVALAKQMLTLLKSLNLGENTEPVILSPGKDYNYFTEYFGTVPGYLIWIIVKVLTWHF